MSIEWRYLGGVGGDGSNVVGAYNGSKGEESGGEEFGLHDDRWGELDY